MLSSTIRTFRVNIWFLGSKCPGKAALTYYFGILRSKIYTGKNIKKNCIKREQNEGDKLRK